MSINHMHSVRGYVGPRAEQRGAAAFIFAGVICCMLAVAVMVALY